MPQQAEQREAFDNYVKLTYLACYLSCSLSQWM